MSGIVTIAGKSLASLGQCLSSRSMGTPERKSSTVTVPHMSGFWDFSAIYGGVAYESREVEYVIDIIGEDRQDMMDQLSALLAWADLAQDEDIYDDDLDGWHLRGSLESTEFEEGADGESGTLTITFLCQPFLVADDETTSATTTGTNHVRNDGMAADLYAWAPGGTATVTMGGVRQSVTSSRSRLATQLMPGDNEVEVSGSAVTLAWRETRL